MKHNPSSPRWLRSINRWLRHRLRPCWAQFLRFSGLIPWAKQRLSREGTVVVLAFHRVLNDREFETTNSPRGMVMRARTFEALATHVAKCYQPISLNDMVPPSCEAFDRLRIAFTFDDGWTDIASTAFPITQRYGIPIVIFVCPSLTGRESPYWPERVIASLRTGDDAPPDLERVIELLKTQSPTERQQSLTRFAEAANPADSTMSWDDIRRLDAAGVLFGSHSQSHPILTQLPFDAVLRELTESRVVIEEALGKPCTLLAYPNGSYAPEVEQAATRAGYRAAFVVTPGAWTPDCDPLAIPRINIWEDEVVDNCGRFTPAVFDYHVIWRAYRNSRRKR